MPVSRLHLATKYGQRSSGQAIERVFLALERRGRGWTVGIGISAFSIRMPLVLGPSKRNYCDGSPKGSFPAAFGVVKYDANLMRVVIVLINEHERPLAIGTMQCVSGHQHLSFCIFYIA